MSSYYLKVGHGRFLAKAFQFDAILLELLTVLLSVPHGVQTHPPSKPKRKGGVKLTTQPPSSGEDKNAWIYTSAPPLSSGLN
jgi:hypothetical protein